MWRGSYCAPGRLAYVSLVLSKQSNYRGYKFELVQYICICMNVGGVRPNYFRLAKCYVSSVGCFSILCNLRNRCTNMISKEASAVTSSLSMALL